MKIYLNLPNLMRENSLGRNANQNFQTKLTKFENTKQQLSRYICRKCVWLSQHYFSVKLDAYVLVIITSWQKCWDSVCTFPYPQFPPMIIDIICIGATPTFWVSDSKCWETIHSLPLMDLSHKPLRFLSLLMAAWHSLLTLMQ